MGDAGRGEIWSSADEYEGYVGRWSSAVAARFLAWLDVTAGGRWIDVGCGTGALTRAILDVCRPREVVGVEPSEAYLEGARARITDLRASFRLAPADRLPDDIGQFDAAVAGLVLNFVPGTRRAVDEMTRVVRPGATVAAYVWDYAGQMQLMRYFWDAAIELFPAAARLDEGRRFAEFNAEGLALLFGDLDEVEVTDITVPTPFASFDDYWSPFLGGQGPAPGFAVGLDEHDREHLRDQLRKRLPIAADGSISLVARAWAVQGQKPT
jgi:SAM-dependent methyltransferase